MAKKCKIDGCKEPAKTKGYCIECAKYYLPESDPEPEPEEEDEPKPDKTEVTVSQIMQEYDFIYCDEGGEDCLYYRHKQSTDVWRSDYVPMVRSFIWKKRLNLRKKGKLREWRSETVEGIKGSMGCPLPAWPRPPIEEIPLGNGVYNWRTGQFFKGYTSTHFFRYKLRAHYDPTADGGWIAELFEEWVGVENLDKLYMLIGLCLLQGFYPAQKLFMLQGNGQDGKSTYIHVIEAILGIRNISRATPEELAGHTKDRFASADIVGKHANIVADVGYGCLEDTSLLKKLTGGDVSRAQDKGKKAFTFESYATMIYSTNKLATAKDQSAGFFRRMYVVDFPNRIPEDKKDATLSDRIMALVDKGTDDERPIPEISGILNTALAALRELADNNWRLPGEAATIEEAAEEYRMRSQPAFLFVRQYITAGEDGGIGCEWLNKTISEWAAQNAHAGKITRRDVNDVMRQEGYTKARDRVQKPSGYGWTYGASYWAGCRCTWPGATATSLLREEDDY